MAEAKVAIDIPLGTNISEWTNQEFKKFIKSKKGPCQEFDKALDWIGDKDYKTAARDCKNHQWISWLDSNKPECHEPIKKGTEITITKGRNEKYALWHNTGIWDLPEEYVGEYKVMVHDN